MTKQKDIYLKNRAKLLTEKQIDRRSFVMSALAAGVALPAALSLAGQAEAATPKTGGKLRQAFGYGSTTDVMDPANSENGFMQAVQFARGNYLTEVSNTGELVGELAESFEPSNNASTWVFNLRRGVEFHNGKTMTPEDVIATFNRHRAEDSTSAAKGLITAVKDIFVENSQMQ